jgi:glycogen debranching enzyme
LAPLSVDDLEYYESRFFLVPGQPTQYVDATLSVVRHRTVGGRFDEQLTIVNHDSGVVNLSIRLEVGTDFADIFEVKDNKQKSGQARATVEDGCLRLRYQRDAFVRETVVSSSVPGLCDEHGLTFNLALEPDAEWSTQLRVDALTSSRSPGEEFGTSLESFQKKLGVRRREQLDEWLSAAPRLVCDSDALTEAYWRGLTDLAALRYPALGYPEELPAAGLPWFMTAFGRDSILTSLQMLPFVPGFASATLRYLAAGIGRTLDDFNEEEPGKIFHEVRYGESAAFREQPHAPYYGAVDASPLFIVLLDEYERWSGDADMVREVEIEVRAALNWIDTYADLMGNGYLWYMRRNEQTGLENQCWKDSWNSISYRDGRLPGVPRAICEAQGYAYDAKLRAARLAREFWDDVPFAEGLEQQAADLKQRFNRDYWIEDGQYYALALDYDGSQVDALSSNIGHLLWSQIVEPSRAPQVAQHLLGPKLFSGWGVRTLAEGEGRYNPVGYHVGTVWPFDNSFIAWGLRQYGFDDEAAQIAKGIIDAAPYFRGRLPEAFAGYHRTQTKYPVEYPTACSPQAWSSGAPFLLLRTMLGLNPICDHLTVDPALPEGINRIELLDVPGRWGRADALGRR